MFRQISEILTLIASASIQFLFYRKRIPKNFTPERILVVKLDHLGDVLLSTPVFSNLRKAYPKATLHALTGKWSRVILEDNPNVDKVIEYNSPAFNRSKQPKSHSKTNQLYKMLHQQNYDLLIELRGDWRIVWFALLRLSPKRLSRAYLQIASKLKRTQFSGTHEVTKNLDVLNHAGISTPIKNTSFTITEENKKWVTQFLTEYKINQELPIIAIHPGSPIILKRWIPERFAELADRFTIQNNSQILFVGVNDEIPIIREIQEQMQGKSTHIAGKTTIPQLAAILHKTTMFVGNDSGPMHIAAAVGTPTVGLFGPGNPNRFGPVGDNCHFIQKKPDCPQCPGKICKFGSEGCMGRIQVNDVIQTIQDSEFLSHMSE